VQWLDAAFTAQSTLSDQYSLLCVKCIHFA
jgi:hypothetical protein